MDCDAESNRISARLRRMHFSMSNWASRKIKGVLSFSSTRRQQSRKSVDAGTQTHLSGDVVSADNKSVQSRYRLRRPICPTYDADRNQYPAVLLDRKDRFQQHWFIEPIVATITEVLQYPWGTDALFMCALVLLAAVCVVAYYVIFVVIPIMALGVLLAIVNSAIFERSLATNVRRLLS
ncbi:uncharacterized protein LOC135390659 isoform X2 [Ornithodoros turicata]